MSSRDLIARSLLEDARADAPPPAAQARIWQSVSQQLHAPLPPTAAAASEALAAKPGVALLGGTALKLVALTIAAASATVWIGARNVSHAPPSAAQVRPATPPPSAASASAPGPAPSSTLSEETQLLAGAQRALARGDARRALQLVDQHAARFPRGKLAQTRDAARVLALCALGNTRAAQRAQRQFLSDWPDSPLQSRVQNACATRAP